MEVTTVSPSPASPTEGDDLCETDVTNVAIHSVTLLISLCGLAGNWAVLWLLSRDFRNYDISQLALADFLVLLFTVPSTLLFLVEDLSCSPIMPFMYLSFVFQLSELSAFWVLFRLMLTSYEVNILDLCVLYCRCNIPFRLWWLVDGVQFWAFFSLFTVISTLTSLCPSHEQDHCRAVVIAMYIIILLLFVAPMVIFPTINVIKAKCSSRKQQPQRRDTVIFIIVLFTLILVIFNFLQQLGYILVSSEVFFLLNCIHSSIKPFIYFVAERCWSSGSTESLRLSLPSVFQKKEAHTAGSDDANTDTMMTPVDPFHCSAEGPRHSFPGVT